MSTQHEHEWERALRCWTTARELLRSNDPDSVADRAFYAVFHAVTALFLLEGRTHTKHEAIETAVHRDLVRSGRVDAHFGASYTKLRELRMVADYGGKTHIDAETAQDAVERAEHLIKEVRRLAAGRLA